MIASFRPTVARALFALLFAGGLALLLFAFAEARRDPVVRTATIALPDWPPGTAPIRVALLSDIHIGNATMGAERLDRIVDRVNALRPDIVLIAGDFIAGHAPDDAARLGEAMVPPLARLRAPLGTVAVLGNHDHWTGAAAVRDQLRRAAVTVVENHAVARGPLAIGVVGDDFTGRADLAATVRALRRLPGARLVLTHSPDIAPNLPDEIPLVLAGHTHCGQIVLPLIGALASASQFGERYRCGTRREPGRLVVVGAGLGTSVLPLRLGAPPDLWLLTLGPAPRHARLRTRP
jgi:predicted MPP superfamily phosphohydrolase